MSAEQGSAPKLFVGQVPQTYGDPELRAVFEKYGTLVDCVVLRDKMSGRSKGCGFVTFSSQTESDAAIAELNEKVQLEGARKELSVKYAQTPAQPQEQMNAPDGWKLYVGMICKQTTKESLRKYCTFSVGVFICVNTMLSILHVFITSHFLSLLVFGVFPSVFRRTFLLTDTLFSPYGELKDVHIITNPDGSSKGSGFVKFGTKEEANAAIIALNGTLNFRTLFVESCL